MTEIKIIKQEENGIAFFEISNEMLKVRMTNLGCHILSVFAPDKNGVLGDVVLGYEDVTDCYRDDSCMGAIVGRVANRIGNASFVLNGKTYPLKANCGRHHLHGGEKGFDRQIFDYKIVDNGIRFHYHSSHMEEGYPGNLDLDVTFLLEGAKLSILYEAETDRDTILNPTCHIYFNLSGKRENISAHRMRIRADEIACVDGEGLAYGEYLKVENTPFDFRCMRELGNALEAEHIQLKNAGGIDHSFLLSGQEDVIELYHRESGRRLLISTDMPVVQVYTANFLAGGCPGKGGAPYDNRAGVALETQVVSNSIQIEKEPKVILRKGQKMQSRTDYTFDCIRDED